MTIERILSVTGGTYCGPSDILDKEVSCIVTDSRKLESGGLFVAMRGERSDGHAYVEQVLANGALCALGEDELALPEGSAYIRVASSGEALKAMAAYYRSVLPAKVVGITGSAGKTSTKETIATFLATAFSVHKTAGNFNNEIGLPLTIFGLKPEHEIAVLEMGINHFGEMTRLAKVARPDIAVITNIGNCHLEFLDDRDGVLRAKTEMFDYLHDGAAVILNGDDDKLATVTSVQGRPPVFFGYGDNCSYRALSVKSHGLSGSDCELDLNGKKLSVHVPVPGSHAIYNVLAACAVADTLGVPYEKMQEAAASLSAIEGRGQILTAGSYTIFNDCYNANPASMRAALEVLSYADGRKVAILGDMLELGENERELHREVGAVAAASGCDVLLTAGRLGADIAEGAKAAKPELPVSHYPNKDELLAALPGILKEGDTILVKASHAIGFEHIVNALTA